MATYRPIETGYKPEFALGAMYAGENAAMARQQADIANLADLFDLRQKGITSNTGEFDLGQKVLLQPSVLAKAGVEERQANLMTTPVLQEKLAADQADWKGRKREEDLKQFLDPLTRKQKAQESLTATQTSKQTEHINALRDILPVLDAQGPLAASARISEMYPDQPEKKDAMLFAIQGGVKGVQNLIDHFALSEPKSIQEMAKQRLDNEGKLAVAVETGKRAVVAAQKAANAAIISNDKNAITASIGLYNQNLNYLKSVQEAIQKNLGQFQPKAQQSPEYEALLKQHKTITKQVNDSQEVLTKLVKSLSVPKVLNKEGDVTETSGVISVTRNPDGSLVIPTTP